MMKFDMDDENGILKWFLNKVMEYGRLRWNFAVSWQIMMKFDMSDGKGILKWFLDKVLKCGQLR